MGSPNKRKVKEGYSMQRLGSEGFFTLQFVKERFSHDDLIEIGKVIFKHLGFEIMDGDSSLRTPHGYIVDLVGIDSEGKTIALEAGNLNTEVGKYGKLTTERDERVADILLTYNYYIHLPYILSYIPDLKNISKSIILKKQSLNKELLELENEKEELITDIKKCRDIIDTMHYKLKQMDYYLAKGSEK